jgi:hypothetical protein
MWAAGALNSLFVLRLLGGADYLQVYGQDQLLALVRLIQARSFDGYYVGLPFFGLSSTAWFCLWFKSRYIPRPLAAGGAIAAAWCAVSAFIFLIYPEFGKAVNLYSLDSPLAAFEMVTFVWILVRGLRQQRTAEHLR